jgi:hypothetical protein
MALVDSGQSIVRPTITKSPAVFQSTRVQAAAQFSGASDAIEATNPPLASEQKASSRDDERCLCVVQDVLPA